MSSPEEALAVAAVADAALAHDGTDPLDEQTRMTLRHHPEQAFVALEPDGFALLLDGRVSVVVDPVVRRNGLGSALLEQLLDEFDAGGHGGPGVLEGWSHGGHPGADRLAALGGFEPVRSLWVMRRSLLEALPGVPDHPGTLRSWQPADATELLRVNAAAFAHHPEQGAMDATNLAERMAEPWFDPADLLVLEEDGQLLGFHWTKRHDDTEAEVYVVGVDPAQQGRGLGKVLTLAGLQHLAGRGNSRVHLYVESDNHPAVAVYSGLGFTHAAADTHVMFRRG